MEIGATITVGIGCLILGYCVGLLSTRPTEIHNSLHIHQANPEPWQGDDEDDEDDDEELRRQRRILRDPENGWR